MNDLSENWYALRDAACAYHQKNSKGPGGAAICICGAGGGGSKACTMLGIIKNLIVYLPTESLPKEWQDHIEQLRNIV